MEFDRVFLQGLGLPGQGEKMGESTVLHLAAGCQWVEANTDYRFVAGQAVPAGVKLFLLKYAELMQSPVADGVQSERMAGMSSAGMSQTFSQRAGLRELLAEAAAQLLGEWYRPVVVAPAEPRWV